MCVTLQLFQSNQGICTHSISLCLDFTLDRVQFNALILLIYFGHKKEALLKLLTVAPPPPFPFTKQTIMIIYHRHQVMIMCRLFTEGSFPRCAVTYLFAKSNSPSCKLVIITIMVMVIVVMGMTGIKKMKITINKFNKKRGRKNYTMISKYVMTKTMMKV